HWQHCRPMPWCNKAAPATEPELREWLQQEGVLEHHKSTIKSRPAPLRFIFESARRSVCFRASGFLFEPIHSQDEDTRVLVLIVIQFSARQPGLRRTADCQPCLRQALRANNFSTWPPGSWTRSAGHI